MDFLVSDDDSNVCPSEVGALTHVATLTSDLKKIRLKVMTTYPSVHVYSGKHTFHSSLINFQCSNHDYRTLCVYFPRLVCILFACQEIIWMENL